MRLFINFSTKTADVRKVCSSSCCFFLKKGAFDRLFLLLPVPASLCLSYRSFLFPCGTRPREWPLKCVSLQRCQLDPFDFPPFRNPADKSASECEWRWGSPCGHTTDVCVDLQTFSVFRIPPSWDLPVEHFRDYIQVKYREIKSTPDNYAYTWVL